jgi:hypothetical protein
MTLYFTIVDTKENAMLLGRLSLGLGLVFVLTAFAVAQLPPDAVILENLKIAEKQKSVDLCPVYLQPSDPKLPAWEYKGVKYRGSKPDAEKKFAADPDKYAKAAQKQRFVNNFMQTMSTIWCPVTDEVTPGGMTQWKRLGLTWESCCTFCDESVAEENFTDALARLKQRAEKTYALIGAKYTEGAKSPVEGAIKKTAEKPKE